MSDRAVRFRPLFRILRLPLVAACGEDSPLLPPPPPSGMSTLLQPGSVSPSRAAVRRR